MSTDTNSDDEEELSIEELEAEREQLEAAGWPTEHVDEKIEELENGDELEERLVDLKIKIREAEEKGLEDDPAVNRLREQAATIAEELEDDASAEERDPQEELAARQRQLEVMEKRGWQSTEHVEEEIEALEQEIAEDDDTETEALSSTDEIEPVKAEELAPKNTVDVDEALEKWGFDDFPRDELGDVIDMFEDRVDCFEDADWNAMADQTRAEIQVLQAAEKGRSEVEFEAAKLLPRNLRSRGE